MKRFTISTITMMVALSASGVTWGCSAAGPTTHVGNIMSVDSERQTFTILDAQTVSPVTFRADDDILEKVTNANGTAIVNYEFDGVDLVALEVVIR